METRLQLFHCGASAQLSASALAVPTPTSRQRSERRVGHAAEAFLSSSCSSSSKTVTSSSRALLCLFFRRSDQVPLSISESLRFV